MAEDYRDDMKHCIYGLDADLIMLGLITHEPNVMILREEVFGAKKKVLNPFMRSTVKYVEKFELFYISIMREYLEMEFLDIKQKLKFEFNIERIIDDFVFFCFFIGNDFLPNLYTMDIESGALDNIFNYYKEILPTLDDYITYHGKIDFKKAEKIFAKLATHELTELKNKLRNIQKECTTRNSVKQKQYEEKRNLKKRMKINTKKESFLISLMNEQNEAKVVEFKQKKVREKIQTFKEKYEDEMKKRGHSAFNFQEDIDNYMKDEIQKNIAKINEKDNEKEIGIDYSQSESQSEPNLSSSSPNTKFKKEKREKKSGKDIDTGGLVNLFVSSDEDIEINSKPLRTVRENEDKIQYIIKQVVKYHRYLKDENYCSDVHIGDISDVDIGEVSDPYVSMDEAFNSVYTKEYAERQDMDLLFQEKLINYYVKDVNQAKAFYYKEKLNIDLETEEGKAEQRNMFSKYLEGLQWVLYYYYRGVKDWRWFYPYHYAPMISDFEKIKEYLDYDFDKVLTPIAPFPPFQSLLFILPRKSRDLIPRCYWSVYQELSEYFPEKFSIDFNGKKMAWETIVLIPFIPEEVVVDFETKKREEAFSDHNSKYII
jgi:5'-3' exonuclease